MQRGNHRPLRNHLIADLVVLIGVAMPLLVHGGDLPSGPHRGIACANCHGGGGTQGERTEGQRSFTAACNGCHELQDAPRGGVLHAFHSDPFRGCTDCHTFHQPSVLKAGETRFTFDFDDPAIEYHCAGCHQQGSDPTMLSYGHQAARELYHSDSENLARLTPSEACLTCHSNGSVIRQASLVSDDFPRFNEHGSHPYGIAVVPGKGNQWSHIRYDLDPRIRLFDDRIECSTCHDLNNDDDDKLVRFETKYELCRGCHERGTDRYDVAGGIWSDGGSIASNVKR